MNRVIVQIRKTTHHPLNVVGSMKTEPPAFCDGCGKNLIQVARRVGVTHTAGDTHCWHCDGPAEDRPSDIVAARHALDQESP